jgi:quinone-modifying oxidoreductase subunit QmoA
MTENSISSDLLIIGAGIAGITAAVEAAETGVNVILVEKNPYIGGKVAQFNQYFPKLCPPSCGLEINTRRLRTNPLIKLYTLAEVTNVVNESGKYKADIRLNPRYVNNQCTVCNECVDVCPEKRKNNFNYLMDETTAIYIPYENSYPQKYVIDIESCKGSGCNKCVEVCKYKAIDLNEKERNITIEADSVICSTGWEPYDANKLDILGYGQFPDVVTNVLMERLAAANGPTKGQILRPSSKEKINSIAFVQCAGSRDENHLEYCSSVCCLASLKQAQYIREQYPDAEIHFHYIDVRSNGLLEDFYNSKKKDEKLHFHRGKVAKVIQDTSSDKLIVEAENTLTGNLMQNAVEMVVLATGMEPTVKNLPIDKALIDENGFFKSNGNGFIGCGVNTKPQDVASVVQEATGSVLKAIQTIRGN